jgi:hypothetical protein
LATWVLDGCQTQRTQDHGGIASYSGGLDLRLRRLPNVLPLNQHASQWSAEALKACKGKTNIAALITMSRLCSKHINFKDRRPVWGRKTSKKYKAQHPIHPTISDSHDFILAGVPLETVFYFNHAVLRDSQRCCVFSNK